MPACKFAQGSAHAWCAAATPSAMLDGVKTRLQYRTSLLEPPVSWLSLAVQAACQRSGLSNNAAFEELEVLLSFTVPVEAADAGKGVALLQWVSGLQSSLECQASVGWGNFRVECEETTQRMQL